MYERKEDLLRITRDDQEVGLSEPRKLVKTYGEKSEAARR